MTYITGGKDLLTLLNKLTLNLLEIFCLDETIQMEFFSYSKPFK